MASRFFIIQCVSSHFFLSKCNTKFLYRDISYGIGSCYDTNCLVEYDGNVTCIEPCSFVGHCRSDYIQWPFDKQNCSMIFGPWMNSQNEIDFAEEDVSINIQGVAKHSQWNLVKASVMKKIVSLNSKDKNYSSSFPNLTYFFTIQRYSSLIAQILKGSVYYKYFISN